MFFMDKQRILGPEQTEKLPQLKIAVYRHISLQ
jgi:hypothetical protein